jgi:hypothetical protein
LSPSADVGALQKRWDTDEAAWLAGTSDVFKRHPDMRGTPFSEWEGLRPDPADYMPNWPENERTHFQMYEDTTEGTPISPVFETPEELARWLADTGASAFGKMTADYEHWLRICLGGWAPIMVIAGGKMMSGVQAIDDATDGDR